MTTGRECDFCFKPAVTYRFHSKREEPWSLCETHGEWQSDLLLNLTFVKELIDISPVDIEIPLSCEDYDPEEPIKGLGHLGEMTFEVNFEQESDLPGILRRSLGRGPVHFVFSREVDIVNPGNELLCGMRVAHDRVETEIREAWIRAVLKATATGHVTELNLARSHVTRRVEYLDTFIRGEKRTSSDRVIGFWSERDALLTAWGK